MSRDDSESEFEKRERRRIARLISKIVREEMEFIKTSPYPDGCIMSNPYCECPMGKRCELLPD